MEIQSQFISLDRYDERYGYLRFTRPRQEAQIGLSMRRYGQLTPIVAVARGESFSVIDGFKRLHAAREIGFENLEGRIFGLSESAAIAAMYSLNQYSRGMVDLEEALVVRELCREQGMAQTEVGVLLGRHKSWVSRRLMLVERLSEEVQCDVRVGLVSTTTARELVRLPRGNQAEVACVIHRHGLTSREASRFVTLFEKANDRQAQQALLECPDHVLIKANGPKEAIAPLESSLSVATNGLKRTAISTINIISQLKARLEQSDSTSWTPKERSVIRPLLGQVRQLILRLDKALETTAQVGGKRDVS